MGEQGGRKDRRAELWSGWQVPWRAPDHPPTGAEARAAVEVGARRRESATTGRENSLAGLMYFSRKLRCQSSNISRRHMRPVIVFPRRRWSSINFRTPSAAK